MPAVLITGGTGLIGRALTSLLQGKGFEVIILTRKKPVRKSRLLPGVQYMTWDIPNQTLDPEAIRQADYIIHLAGAGVADRRWTVRRKKEIRNSRVDSSALLVKSLREIPHRVKAIVSASAIGWYGRDQSAPFIETDPPDGGFLGVTCQQWEAAIGPVSDLGVRLVILRTGIVLSSQGGALPSFKKPLRLGVAAIIGSGRQMISWIHITDLCRIYLEAIQQDSLSGVYNAVSMNPVDNQTLTLALARKMKGRFFTPVHLPSLLLNWMLGEMSIEVLKSTSVSAAKLKSTGFQFIYPSIEAALDDLIRPASP